MNKKISILGSTGSIGVQTLEVVRSDRNISVAGLSTNTNVKLLYEQVLEFKPDAVAVFNVDYVEDFLNLVKDIDYDLKVYSGLNGLNKLSTLDCIDTVVTSVVGSVGIIPTISAIEHGKNIALANKETLVSAGDIVMKKALEFKVSILPIDSEHSAIFQCLHGNDCLSVNKIILTASGGSFRGKKRDDLKNVSVEKALNHPNWKMGKKITVDSATLMNKGFEVIEAKWLFNVDINDIEVVIHPQSVIHSMVEFIDGSVIAQLGAPDMRVPIQYALYYPIRRFNNFSRLDFRINNVLTFEQPDLDTFPCLRLAYEAIKAGNLYPAVLNAANEACVSLFLDGCIEFLDIPQIIESSLNAYNISNDLSVDSILMTDRWARDFVYSNTSFKV